VARINLLPWREAERKRRQREFLAMAAACATATLVIGLAIHMQIGHLIDGQQARNDFLRREISEINRQIREIQELEQTKANLLTRMDVIQQLQQSRPREVRLFDELLSAVPQSVVLTRIEQRGTEVIIEGRAQSNARVSALMRNIEASPWIGDPRLLLIEHRDKTGTGLSHFRMQLHQETPSEGQESEARAGGGA
jgi:type IV pilus assembly protein PilN